jgi:hypothetical protein
LCKEKTTAKRYPNQFSFWLAARDRNISEGKRERVLFGRIVTFLEVKKNDIEAKNPWFLNV